MVFGVILALGFGSGLWRLLLAFLRPGGQW